MIPASSSQQMRQSLGGQYGPQPYSINGIPGIQPLRVPQLRGMNSSFVSMSPSRQQPLTSMMGGFFSDSPIAPNRRFNSYKENHRENGMNSSNISIRPPGASSPRFVNPLELVAAQKPVVQPAGRVSVGGSGFSGQPGDSAVFVDQSHYNVSILPQRAVVQPIEPPTTHSAGPTRQSPQSTSVQQLEEALAKERDERKQLKAMLKAERKEFDILQDKVKKYESSGEQIKLLQTELVALRNEKMLSDQMDEEHSAKMKVYTEDLMATSVKYQEEIKLLIARNDELVHQVELLRAKSKETDRQNEHLVVVQESLNKKLGARDGEILQLKKELEKFAHKGGVENNNFKIKELETLVKKQTDSIAALEAKLKAAPTAPTSQTTKKAKNEDNDAFSILRGGPPSAAPSPSAKKSSRRPSLHLTARNEVVTMGMPADINDWLEPLAIAEHVLNAGSPM